MQQLVQYPYGCVEQLSSRLVPFVAIREVSRVFGIDPGVNASSSADGGRDEPARCASSPSATTAATAGRSRPGGQGDGEEDPRSADVPSGGFIHWPSALSCASAWPSIYATLALQPREGGGLLRSMPLVLASAEAVLSPARRPAPASARAETIGPETRAFALQVLARMGAPHARLLRRALRARKDKLPLFGKSAARRTRSTDSGKGKRPARAGADAGRARNHAQETPGEVHFAENDPGTYAPLFSSDARTTGMALQTLVDMEPGHPFISKITRYFAAVRRGTGSFRNTQESRSIAQR